MRPRLARRCLLGVQGRTVGFLCTRGLAGKSPLEFQSESRRLKFEQPGTNRGLSAIYLKGGYPNYPGYPGWSTHFLPHLDVNRWQKMAMFEAECEKALFMDDPGNYDMEELGFTREIDIPEFIRPIKDQKPSEYVLYHDLCEMWKRRQAINIPFVSVGSYVEVKMRSQWDLSLPLKFRGIVIEKEHRNLKAYFVIRQNLSSYGYGVENLIPMYSPYLESVEVLSYQVRNDPSGNLQCLRDLTRIQSDIPSEFPDPIFDPETGQEVPHFVEIREEYREKEKQKRHMKSSKHLRPQRMDTVRNYKLWETDPDERYPRPSIYGKKWRE